MFECLLWKCRNLWLLCPTPPPKKKALPAALLLNFQCEREKAQQCNSNTEREREREHSHASHTIPTVSISSSGLLHSFFSVIIITISAAVVASTSATTVSVEGRVLRAWLTAVRLVLVVVQIAQPRLDNLIVLFLLKNGRHNLLPLELLHNVIPRFPLQGHMRVFELLVVVVEEHRVKVQPDARNAGHINRRLVHRVEDILHGRK